jgi:diacylglycerol kinase family enzyme
VYFVLIYNPVAGRNRHRRAAQIRQVSLALSALGHRIEVVETNAPGSATSQAQNAARGKPDAVFACGGDGTIHEVLQGLASETGEPTAVMGIILLGSANALARHLGISLNPLTAALEGINGRPQTIPVGKVTYGDQARYFTVMAGAGPDGALVYDLPTDRNRVLAAWPIPCTPLACLPRAAFPRLKSNLPMRKQERSALKRP